MEVPSKTIKPYSGNDETESERQKSTCSTITRMASDSNNHGVLAAVNKLTNLVEGHPHFYSKLESMLEDLYNELEPKVSAATRKQKNENSCPIYKVSNDELKHIFGYVGEMQYGFVACTSDRFHQVYLETFGNETLTSFRNATVSVSCMTLCLATERIDGNFRAKSLFYTAARDGKLDVLEWGNASGYNLKQLLDEDTVAGAALNGHLEVVQYLRTLGISWNSDTCANAAFNGHLKLLIWARENQCPWDARTCSKAAENGHLKLLKWARANGCPWNTATCFNAARNGHLELLKWARANQCPWNETTCTNAAYNGHLGLLKWVRANGCPWDKRTCSSAAYNGHLELLKWAKENLCPWDELTCNLAAQNGHLELLKWARAHQCPWDTWTCSNAAYNGHLELLKWARAKGCPWDKRTCSNAARNGHLELLKWARENQCPWDEVTCNVAASIRTEQTKECK